MPAVRTIFPARNKVTLVGTAANPKRRGYYIEITKELARKLEISNWAVLVFNHPAFQLDADLGNRGRGYLAIHCEVRIVKKHTDRPNEIGADQTLRNALGIPFLAFKKKFNFRNDDFYLLPARSSWFRSIRLWVSRIFGIRFSALRAKSGNLVDIEKNYVRVPASVRSTLGVCEADDLIVERPFEGSNSIVVRDFNIRSIKLSVFEASDKMLEARADLERRSPQRFRDGQRVLYDFQHFIDHEYIGANDIEKIDELTPQTTNDTSSSKKIWPFEPDIPPIFMDFDARAHGFRHETKQETDYLTPLIVRRSLRSAIARESVQSGITFGIGFINLSLAITKIYGDGPANKNSHLILIYLVAALIAFAITAWLLATKLRQQI